MDHAQICKYFNLDIFMLFHYRWKKNTMLCQPYIKGHEDDDTWVPT